MFLLESFILSITMAADAMCAAASDGIKEHDIKLSKGFLIALSFGVFQFIMPVIGYFISFAVYEYIQFYIPWIAFGIMALLGIKSLVDGIKEFKSSINEERNSLDTTKVKPLEIFIQSIATSIDALSVGFTLTASTSNVSEAMLTCGIIGLVTMLLSFLCVIFGKKIGIYIEKYASIISGLIFIALSIKFLVEAIMFVL